VTEIAGMSRREFLAAANAAALLLFLESCNLGPLGRQSASPSVPAGATPVEQALKLLRDAVRASPDHLAQRATDLVSKRDAAGIVEFVRSDIAVIPSLSEGDGAPSSRTWGSAATLRGGQGTLRDRAEMLADMLTRAGFKAQVAVANRPTSVTLESLYQPRAAAFAPDQSRIDLAQRILRQAKYPAASSPSPVSAAPDPTQAILNALPQSLQVAPVRSDLLPTRVPLVVFDDSGKKRYAYAMGGVAVTDTAPSALDTEDAGPIHTIDITVSAVSNPPPGSVTPRGRIVDLVTASWPADKVVGRQVLLTFVPPQGAKAVVEDGLSPFPVRLPILRVQTGAAPTAADTSLIAVGALVTVQGDVLGSAAGAAPPSPGAGMAGPFGTIQVLSDPARAQALARVAAIQATVNASAFPEIELDVALADSSGAPVDGLDAGSLTVMEKGAPVDGFTLYSNVKVQQRPRVLITSDVGAADQWPTLAAKTAFENGLDAALAALAAKTPFDIQFNPVGQPPDPGAWVLPQAGALASALSKAHEALDDPWLSVGGPVLEQGVVAIVLLSDMNTGDTDPVRLPTLKRSLTAASVPVFTVPTGAVNQATAAEIVSLSGGAAFDPSDSSAPTKIAQLLAPLVSKWVGTAYRIRYQTHTDGPSQRGVTIGLAGRPQPRATANYTVPANPVPPPAFSGLYVTIKFGPLMAMRRLAGLEIGSRFGAPIGALDDPIAVAETRAAINGVTTIAIEPGTPTTAALLEDVIASSLSLAPLLPIWPPESADKLLQAIPGGILRTPFALPSLLRPTRIDPATVPLLRVAIFQERAGSGAIEQHADLAVGLNPVAPITTDRHAAFKATTATSVAACAAEATTYPDSAYALLSGRALTAIASGDSGTLNAWIAKRPVGKQTAWQTVARVYDSYHLVLPSAGDADAMWVVDPATGLAKAVLLDSSGGAIRTACILSNEDLLAIALGMLSIFCMAVPNFACLGINVAAAGMTAAAMFSHPFTIADPLAIILAFRPLAGFGWNAAFGILVMMIVFENAGCTV
jgi:hypothetical protein